MAVIGRKVLLGFGDVAMLGSLKAEQGFVKIKFCDTLGVVGDGARDCEIDHKSDNPPVEIAFDLESGMVLLEMVQNGVAALQRLKISQQVTS